MESITAQMLINYRQRLSQGIHCLVTIIDVFYKQYLYSAHAETFF